ncbi:hypothetical protein [Candidatus Methylospira mobilis]|nr:hypothetical protein [Candidatus Methylospira mobilis]
MKYKEAITLSLQQFAPENANFATLLINFVVTLDKYAQNHVSAN